MRIYPGIDIHNGKCVRVVQGSDDYKDYGNPIDWAIKWQDMGAECIHIIDMDAAVSGDRSNYPIVKQIVKSLKIPVQFGGGIRSRDAIKRCFEEIGISRIVIGTLAVENFDEVARARSLFGDRIVVSIDVKDGKVASRGRADTSDLNASDLALKMHQIGVDSIIYTDILRDGTLEGPNLERTEEIIKKTWMNVLVSGGIHKIDDIIGIRGTGACGAIIGRALYEDTVDFKEALALK